MAPKRDDRPNEPDDIQARITTPPVPGDPNLDDATLKDPSVMPGGPGTAAGAVGDPVGDRTAAGATSRDPVLSDPAATVPGATDPRVNDPATVGAADAAPGSDPAARDKRVAVYDRPTGRGRSGLIIGVVVLVIIILAVIFLMR